MGYPDGHSFGIDQIPKVPFIYTYSPCLGLSLLRDFLGDVFLTGKLIFNKDNGYFRSQLLVSLLPVGGSQPGPDFTFICVQFHLIGKCLAFQAVKTIPNLRCGLYSVSDPSQLCQ